MKLHKFTLITTNILTITTLGAVSCTSEQKPKDPEPTPQPDPNVTAANSFKTTHSEVLNKTISNITLPDEAKVTAALNAYNSLEQAVKNNLTSQKTLLDNLNAKILQLKQAQNKPEPAPDQTETAANNFKNAHATVLAKTVDTLALEDETSVNNALNAFNNLEQNVKDKLTSEKTLLDQLVAKIADLKEQAKNNQGTGEAEQPQRNTGPNFGGTDQFGGDPANPVTLNLFEFSVADDLGARFDKLLKEYLAKEAQKNDQRLKQMQIYGPTNETNQQVYLSIQGSGGKPETALLKLKEGFEVAKLEGTVNNQKKRFIAEFNTETRVLKITYKYDNKEYYDSLTIPAAKPATPSQETQNNQDTQVPKETTPSNDSTNQQGSSSQPGTTTTPSTEQPKQEEENKSTETQNPDANNTQNNGGTSGENTDGNTQVTQNTENTQSDANKGASSSTQADAPDQSGTATSPDSPTSNSNDQTSSKSPTDTQKTDKQQEVESNGSGSGSVKNAEGQSTQTENSESEKEQNTAQNSEATNSQTNSQQRTTNEVTQNESKKIESSWSADANKSDPKAEANYYKFQDQLRELYKDTLLSSQHFETLKLQDVLPLRNFMAAILGISNINDLKGSDNTSEWKINSNLLKEGATGYDNEKDSGELSLRKLESHFLGVDGDKSDNDKNTYIEKLKTALLSDINKTESSTTEGMEKIKKEIQDKVRNFVNTYRKDGTLEEDKLKKYVDDYLNTYLNVAKVRATFSILYTINSNSNSTWNVNFDEIFEKIFAYKGETKISGQNDKKFKDNFWTNNTNTEPANEANYYKVENHQKMLDRLYKHLTDNFAKLSDTTAKDILPLRNTVAALLSISDVTTLKGKENSNTEDKDWLVAKELLKENVDSASNPSYASLRHDNSEALHIRKIEKEIFGVHGDEYSKDTNKTFIKDLAVKLNTEGQENTQLTQTYTDIKNKAKNFVDNYAKTETKISDEDIEKITKLYFNTYLNKARIVQWSLTFLKNQANLDKDTQESGAHSA
ncbi:hypothetical protein CO229_00780 [Mycoplasmopsis bovirhinis]|uniref:hypothetical protein n=1 Tax=Mycoplasmopsis bovirhinis TaxID=29553 RepID=UPI000C0587B0|nr:hypothetical protein [Mycoplasmopsis bovirhinis]ATO30657.1 hypothetical protein CO229_00780 [Mycoplasmopsis bovirhinis]